MSMFSMSMFSMVGGNDVRNVGMVVIIVVVISGAEDKRGHGLVLL